MRRLKQSIKESAKRQTEYMPTDSCADDDADDSDPIPSHNVKSSGSKLLKQNIHINPTQFVTKNKRSMSLHAATDSLEIRNTFKDSFYEDEATSD